MGNPETSTWSFSQWAAGNLELTAAAAAVKDLPAMADIVTDFLMATQDPDWTAKGLAMVVAKDPGIAACVLKVANSSYYSFQRQITSLEGAVSILGLKTLKSLVLAAGVKTMNKRFGLIEKLLVEDSIGSALSARAIARQTGNLDPEEAFLAGLMRHIGKIAMNNISPENYVEIIQGVYNQEGSLANLERKHFPYTHSAIGAALLDSWNLSPALVACTLFHSDPPPAGEFDKPTQLLLATVNLAGSVCQRLGIGQRQAEESLQLLNTPAANQLQLDEATIDAVLEEVTGAFEETRQSFLGGS
jgi:HD-like signal output (HDOD) protein